MRYRGHATIATCWGMTARMALVVDHDDGQREPAYTGGADKLLQVAKENGWVMASVKDDRDTVFID